MLTSLLFVLIVIICIIVITWMYFQDRFNEATVRSIAAQQDLNITVKKRMDAMSDMILASMSGKDADDEH